MASMNDMIKNGRKKLKSPDGRKAIEFLEKNKGILRAIGKELFIQSLARIGLKDGVNKTQLKKELILIQMQDNPDMLIEAVEGSGNVMKAAHEIAEREAERYNKMFKDLAVKAAKELLPLIVRMF